MPVVRKGLIAGHLWVPRIMSHGLSWPHSAGPGASCSTFGCASTSRSATVGACDTTLRLLGIAAHARLAGLARPVRSGQRCRDLGPAPPGRSAPTPRQSTKAVLGRPRDPVRAGPAAPPKAPQPASPDRLAAYPAALARRHRQAPLALPTPASRTPACPSRCPRAGGGKGARQPSLGI